MKPTYIYIKTCSHCNLKYFGKTTQDNPYRYKGSGKYWSRHIKKHGYSCRTFIIRIFYKEQECIDFCIWFSKVNNIVKSKKWANLKIENGLDGNPKGVNHCEGRIMKEDTRRKIGNANRGRTAWNKGIKQTIIKCPHCDKEGGNTMKRWHFDNCRHKDTLKN